MKALLEVDYFRTGPITGERLRRQLLQVAKGWQLSPAVPVGHVGSLRNYRGGVCRTDHVFPDRAEAEHYLQAHNWATGGDDDQKTRVHGKGGKPAS